MAVGPDLWPEMHPVKGFRQGTAKARIKYLDRRDLVVMSWSQEAAVAGVFTRNRFCAAPVHLAKERLEGSPQYFLVNTGNANAGTGAEGLENARKTTERLAELTSSHAGAVLPFSTGVIGEPLPVERIMDGLPEAVASLNENSWLEAAEGILTTDTRPKGSSRQFEVDGVVYTVTGISKGSGMIKPNMATMLAFIATDAAVKKDCLQSLLSKVADQSFNRISVDGDTSTNDACMLVATGEAGNVEISGQCDLYTQLFTAVKEVAKDLAQAIVRDGEGATKFVTVRVEQAACERDALEVAYTIAHSPLVKTALFASDPNWGRILAAVGRADVEQLQIDRIALWLDDVCLVEKGEPHPDYSEQEGQRVMDQEVLTIRVQLGAGNVTEEIWTTDLSHDYVRINAEYRS